MNTIKINGINGNNGNFKRFVLPYANPASDEAKAAAKAAKAAAARRRKEALAAARAEKKAAKAAAKEVTAAKQALSAERKSLGAVIRLVADSDDQTSNVFRQITGLKRGSSAADRRAVMQWIMSVFPNVQMDVEGRKVLVKKTGPKKREQGIFWADITDMLEAVNIVIKLSVTKQLTGFQNVVADDRPNATGLVDDQPAERSSIISPLLRK